MKAEINGINLEYTDQGKGLPIILIHAFPLDKGMWEPQVEPLSKVCRVITVDLRGFGQSDVPAGPYWMSLMASDVRGLMYKLGIDRAVLVGLSMGGYVAMSFYRNFPDAVKAMVLADTRASADNEEGRQRRFAAAQKAEAEGSAAVAEDMLKVLLGATTHASRPEVVERVRQIIMKNQPRAIAAAQLGMAARPDSMELLTKVTRPVMVISGSEDTLSPPYLAEAIQWRVPGSSLTIIEGAGHLPNIECPDEFNEAVIRFLGYLR